MPSWSQENFKDFVCDDTQFPNLNYQIGIQNVLNRAVRKVLQEVDVRSTIRRAPLTQKLFDDIYDYSAPTDLKEEAVIDVVPQANRTASSRLNLVTADRFDRRKLLDRRLIAFTDDDLTRKLRLNLDVSDTIITPATLDSLTADGGTWTAYSDATSVATDTSNYIMGSGAVKFDLTGSATTAGLTNSSLAAFDITNYINDGSVFVWVYINSTTNLTNWILEIGNDTSNYYTQTVTTDNSSNAFQNGWNLLRFDFASMTQTGTVAPTTCDHIRIYMTKSSGKSDDGYRVDNISLHTGQYHDIVYYSKYGWQTSGGTFQESSTATTDKLNADTEEIDLFVAMGKVEVWRELREYTQMQLAEKDYENMRKTYQTKNPSKRVRKDLNYWTGNKASVA